MPAWLSSRGQRAIDARGTEHRREPIGLERLPPRFDDRCQRLYGTVDFLTGGRPRLGTSTLYAALTRLQRAEVIADAPPPPDADSTDARRRYYQITAFGRAVMREEALRIRQLDRLLADAKILEAAPRSRGGA